MALRNARINAVIAGEQQPRVFHVSDTLVQLGRGYRTVDASLTAMAHERDPAADKCTMISETFQRHLRRNAGPQAPIVRLPDAAQPDGGEGESDSRAARGAGAAERQAHWRQAAHQAGHPALADAWRDARPAGTITLRPEACPEMSAFGLCRPDRFPHACQVPSLLCVFVATAPCP